MKTKLEYSKGHVIYLIFNIVAILFFGISVYFYKMDEMKMTTILIIFSIYIIAAIFLNRFIKKKYGFKIDDKGINPFMFLSLIALNIYLSYNKLWALILFILFSFFIFLLVMYRSIKEYN